MRLKAGQGRELFGEKADSVGMTRKLLMRVPSPVIDLRMQLSDSLKPGTARSRGFTPRDHLKAVPAGKHSALPAGRHEAGVFMCTARDNRMDPHWMRVISRFLEISER